MKLDDMPAFGSSTAAPSPPTRPARVLFALLERLKVGKLDLIAPDGAARTFASGFDGPHAMIRLKDWKVCEDVMRSGDIGFAESFMMGRWHTPDLAELLTLVASNRSALDRAIYGRWWGGLAYRLRHVRRGNRRAQARRNVQAHYDLGNDFYALWLDETLTYSSGIFSGHKGMSLEMAQAAKYERICETLGLKAGDRVLEIGCGWGGFAEHAAFTRRCSVHGVTLSGEQLSYAVNRIRQRDLSDLVTFELRDYRDVQGEYDYIVSIEMFEAVGERYWPTYFRMLRDRLARGGRALIQTIIIADDLYARYRHGTDFIQQYVFPGGMLPSEEVFRDVAYRQGLVIGRPFTFRIDYAETLKRWRHRFNRRVGELNAMGFDDRFMRLWNFYLAYCEAGFRTRNIDVMQIELKRV
ncbi:MAG: class I SAM-dependent methyltransferase [Burkholderiales bacterium]